MTADRFDSHGTRRHAGPVASAPRPESEEPLPTLEGRVVTFGLELTAADILAEPHAALPATDARHHLFAAIDAGLAARIDAGDVIVADEMTGSTAAARPAIAALVAARVTALVARRITPDLALSASAQGLVALIVDTPSFLHTGDRVRLDLDAAKIVNLSSGDRVAIRNLGDDERSRLRTALERRASPQRARP